MYSIVKVFESNFFE